MLLVDSICKEPESERAPGTLMLHLLGRCNLECVHCYMDGGPSRRELLRLEDVLGAIAACAEIGIGQVYLTGGEPLLYPGLHDALRAAARCRLKITVCTNGTIGTPRHVSVLREVGARAQVSVDGPESFHDAFRRLDGAFRATERGVRAFTAAGVPVTIVATISGANVDAVGGLVEWARAAGADELRVQPLLDLGRGRAIADQRLTPAQLNRLLLELSDVANSSARHGLKCSLVGVTRQFLLAHPCGAYVCNGTGCHRRMEREIKKIVVREDGTILPEATNLSPRFAMGNLRDGPLAETVRRYFTSGYERFDRLCREAYAEVVPSWPTAVVPWDQIIAARSHTFVDDEAPARRVASLCSVGPSCAQRACE